MTITTVDQIANALANNRSTFVVDKSSIANLVAGQQASLWRATGQPAQAAIPGSTPALCTSALTGAIAFTNQTAPATSYLAYLTLAAANAAMSWEVHDRIAHVGGLVLNVATLQTITGLNLTAGGLNPPAARLGASNYSDVQWWLEVYSDGGGTAANATVNVTYNDGSSGNLNVIAVGGTIRAGRLVALTPFIPTADQGKFIRGVNNVQLSISTGTAGNFGFTATRFRGLLSTLIANKSERAYWADLPINEVPNDSCLMLLCLTSTTSSGTLRGNGVIAHG